ncbi:MAG: HlyD family type I secretion periplasmic adaptor subunit [Paracoccaceae bacterium]
MSIKSPTLHVTIWFTISVFAVIVVMACIFKVEVVARGEGKVVPFSRVQVVQPEFDGKIVAIHTANGTRVERGDRLVEFDVTDAEAEVNTIVSEMDRLIIERARIGTLVDGIDNGTLDKQDGATGVAEAFVMVEHEEQVFFAEQQQLLSAEIADMQAAFNQFDARIEANAKSIGVTQANIERVEAALAIQKERLEVAKGLLEREVTSRASFLDIQEAFTMLEKERDIYLKELQHKQTQESAIWAERRSLIAGQRSTHLERRSEIEARLATLTEQRKTAERRIRAATLHAPLSGTVDQFDTHTIGAVIKSGEDLLKVVPNDQTFEIEAAFSNSDIGFMEVGQQANINLDAYPSARFGFVKGAVTDVAADSTEVSEGVWAFAVRIRPDQNVLESGEQEFQVRPGMTAKVDVTTDERRLISYFFAPIVETVQSSLGER